MILGPVLSLQAWRQSAAAKPLPFITGVGTAVLRNDFAGWVGYEINVGARDLRLTALGRLFFTGNSHTHDVGVFDELGNPILIVSVDCTSGTDQQFNYTAADLILSSGVTYIIASLEDTDQWRDSETTDVTTGDANISGRSFRSGSGTGGAFDGSAGPAGFVPPNFLYLPQRGPVFFAPSGEPYLSPAGQPYLQRP